MPRTSTSHRADRYAEPTAAQSGTRCRSCRQPVVPQYAPRTRAVLLVLLAVLTGVVTHLVYGPTFGLVGFAAGAVVALLLGALLGRIGAWRAQR